MIQVFLVLAVTAMSFVLWFIYYGLECFINGGTLGRNPVTAIFSMAYQELTWFIPGGRRRRGEYIRERMCDCERGAMCGSRRSWTYKEIRDRNLYDEVGADMLPGRLHFVLTHIVLPFGPPAVVAWILFGA